MARPIMLGIVGDSASGKTTLSKGLVQLLGRDSVSAICTDDYHKYDRRQRAERGITPLNPECNYLDIMGQHLQCLRMGEGILKPVYVRVYLDPPESLRRQWKVDRDCSKRGYTTDEVLADLDRREPDSESFIRPQRRHADIVVCRMESEEDPFILDARLTLRDGLSHPDFAPFADESDGHITLEERDGECVLSIKGALPRERAAVIEEDIWDRLHFARHLRSEKLGEFTVGNDVHRSESLALVQLLIVYHLTTARARVALGSEPDAADEALAS